MKMVSCIIRPEKLDAVTTALDKQHVVGMTLTDVRGFGRQKGHVEHYRGGEYAIRFISKVKVDIVVQDEVDAFTACLAVYPETGKAVLGRAMARFQVKDWKAAQQDFQRASDLEPDDPESWLGVGMSLAMQSKIYPALEALEKLLVRFPNFVRGYMQLGMLHI